MQRFDKSEHFYFVRASRRALLTTAYGLQPPTLPLAPSLQPRAQRTLRFSLTLSAINSNRPKRRFLVK